MPLQNGGYCAANFLWFCYIPQLLAGFEKISCSPSLLNKEKQVKDCSSSASMDLLN
jgi:hypothetical protein